MIDQSKVKRALAWVFTFLAGMCFDGSMTAATTGKAWVASMLLIVTAVMIGQSRSCCGWLRRNGS